MRPWMLAERSPVRWAGSRDAERSVQGAAGAPRLQLTFHATLPAG